jgi:ankyrin repeat protein
MSGPGDVFTAAEAGDLSRIRELVADTPSLVTARDGEGATALHHAALGGSREVAGFLVEHGADVNARDDRFGATPTGWAIEPLRALGGLLAIEIDDLALAIRQREAGWVQRFLRRLPALADAKDGSGTPLRHIADESGSPEIARLFREGA